MHTMHGDRDNANVVAIQFFNTDAEHTTVALSQGKLAYIRDAAKICVHDGVTKGGVFCVDAAGAVPVDKYLTNVGNYNTAVNVVNFYMSDGSVVMWDLSPVLADFLAAVPNVHVPATLTSPASTITTGAVGANFQAFSVDINPETTALALITSPTALATLQAALDTDEQLASEVPVGPPVRGGLDVQTALQNISDAIPNVLPPIGPAGGGLLGTYPNPTLNPVAVLAAVPLATDTVQGRVAMAVAANFPQPTNDADAVTPAYLEARINALPVAPTTLPPSGPAGGELAGAYPNPQLSTAAVNARVVVATDTTQGKVALATAANYPQSTNDLDAATPAYVQAAIAAIPAAVDDYIVSGAYTAGNDTLTLTRLSGGTVPIVLTSLVNDVLAGVPVAADTVQGKVALAIAANYPQPGNDADAVTPAYLAAAIAAIPAAVDDYVVSAAYTAGNDTLRFTRALGGTFDVVLTSLIADVIATLPAAADTVQGKVALAVAANYPQNANDLDAVTPAYLAAAIAAIPPTTAAAPTGPAGGDLAGNYPNPTVVVATDTVQGKVALAVGANYPAAGVANNDVDAVTPLYLKNAIAAIPPNAPVAATLPDLLAPSTSAGKYVTDDVFRAALDSGQDRFINVTSDGTTDAVKGAVTGAGPGTGGSFANTSTGSGYGVIGARAGTGDGAAVLGVHTGSGIGHAGQFVYNGSGAGNALVGEYIAGGAGSGVRGEIVNGGTGAGVYAAVGAPTSGGTGPALFAVNGVTGTRLTTAFFLVQGPNTTWGTYTNGAVFAGAGFTSSDKRLKTEVRTIDPDLAMELARRIRYTEFDKLSMPTGIGGAMEMMKSESKEVVDEPQQYVLGRFAGVIAQELQELTRELGAFEWLVRPVDPNDKDSLLSVDMAGLSAVIEAGNQARLAKIEKRLASLK